jgi:hypothetical protein
MILLTVYQNGVRYYSAPINELPKDESKTVIKGKGIRADCRIYEDGSRYDSLFQEITDDEFSIYKADPDTFTAKKVF